ncbi:hypothetical protein C8J57DRAFT_1719432 [Mycena rebaudengoi]|nr:hypothetical protein C8J57DRAFT_1719432 [Mycena rebaudengoi]
MADKVAALETLVESMQEQLQLNARTIRVMNQDQEDLRDRLEELEIVNENLISEREDLTAKFDSMLEQVDDLMASSAAQHTSLEKFGELFEEMGGSEEVTANLSAKRAKTANRALKVPRDNVLHGGIRTLFYKSMGLERATATMEVMQPPTPGGGWINDPETSGGRLLRPDWRVSFSDNSMWHDEIVKFVKTHLHSEVPAISNDSALAMSDAEVRSHVQTVFKGIMGKYRKWEKTKATPSTVGDATKDEAASVKNLRAQRKVRKLAPREKVRPKEMGAEWDWFFQTSYQSIDETDTADILDPDTDTDQNVPVSSTIKPLITWVSEYRSEELDAGVQYLDKLVADSRKGQDPKTAPRPRKRGAVKNVSLPRIGQGKPRIPRVAICPAWLKKNQEEDVPSRIAEEEGHEEENGSLADDEQ